MNFLEIAKRVRQECGLSGDGPSNVAGQTGMYAKVVGWTHAAHDEIQRKSDCWNFDWSTHAQPLAAGVESYDPASDWGMAVKSFDQEGLYVYRTADGPRAKTWTALVDWAAFRQMRVPGITGTPVYASLAPNGHLYFHPAPIDGLTAVMECYQEPQVLQGNADVPRMPARFHMAIVWRAVMFWAAHDEAAAQYQSAEKNYRTLLHEMRLSELPDMTLAGPIA